MKYNELPTSKISGIYQILNTSNGKSYIGQSQNIRRRWARHWYEAYTNPMFNYPLYLAMRKYGPEVWDFILLEELPNEELNSAEIKWIDHFASFSEGYNTTEGGGGLRGRHQTQETKDKIGSKHKGKVVSEETKAKMSASQRKCKKGPQSPEHKEKRLSQLRGKPRSEATKEKMRNRVVSESTKEKHRNKVVSDTTREKIRQSWVIRRQNKLASPV